MYGRPYIFGVETGRKATPQYTKPSIEFVNSIKEWARAKGVNEGFAYAIAKKIHKSGTKLFQQGGRKDIITPVTKSLSDEITKDLTSKFANSFIVNVIDTFNRGNTN